MPDVRSDLEEVDFLNTPEEVRDLLVAHGITLADCIRAFAAPEDDPLVALAREQYHCDGEIEIDHFTVRSGSDGPGDYILAWVWVDNPGEEVE